MASQRITHGTTIDTATPDEVASIVAAALDARQSEDYTRRPGVVKLNTAGAGQDSLDVSPQYDWRCERISIGGGGAANALVQLYENDSNSDGNLLEVIQVGSLGKYTDGFSNNLYVPAGSQIIIVVSGGLANQDVAYRLQVKQVRAVK